MIINNSKYKLDIDLEATRKYYDKSKEYECICSGCRNFIKAADMLPEELKLQLKYLGVDYKKLMRVSAIIKQEESILYNCNFRVIGTMQVKEYGKPKEDILFIYSDDYSHFYPCDDFPTPCLEGTFMVNLPWVIDEKCDY